MEEIGVVIFQLIREFEYKYRIEQVNQGYEFSTSWKKSLKNINTSFEMHQAPLKP